MLHHQTSLADLEHYVLQQQLADYEGIGPEKMQGYLTGHWYLTALPQAIHQFRKSEPTTKIFSMYSQEDNNTLFVEKDYDGTPIPREDILNISRHDFSSEYEKRLWMPRNYKNILERYAEAQGRSVRTVSLKYGELSFVYREGEGYEYSDQFGLVRK